MLVRIIEEPSHKRDLEALGMDDDAFKVPEPLEDEHATDTNKRITFRELEHWVDLCYAARHGWLDGERVLRAKRRVTAGRMPGERFRRR